MLKRLAALFVAKCTMMSGFSAWGAQICHMKTDGGYYFCDTYARDKMGCGWCSSHIHIAYFPAHYDWTIIIFILFIACTIWFMVN
jgi:hypothetical protein